MTSLDVCGAAGRSAFAGQEQGLGLLVNVTHIRSRCIFSKPWKAACRVGVGSKPVGKSKRVVVECKGPEGDRLVANAAVAQAPVLSGGALDFRGLPEALVGKMLVAEKEIVLVRHGLSSWNAEGRIQGSSDQSVLSELGQVQVERCRDALSRLKFDRAFASPISRARSSAELIWAGREEPLEFLDGLREANLLFLEGMRNEDAAAQYPELYRAWREDPANFHVNGVYPVRDLWAQARDTWRDILSAPGQLVMVVTHKSILRALLCTALGLGTGSFRSIDINNAGVCSIVVNMEGKAMLKSLNMTAHLHTDGVYYDN